MDGNGTAIMTESSWINSNRNPGLTKAQVEAGAQGQSGAAQDHLAAGDRAGRDITDAHVDFYARFCAPRVVVINMDNDPGSYDYKVTRQHLAILQQATDADGNKLELHQLPPPLGGRDKSSAAARTLPPVTSTTCPSTAPSSLPSLGCQADRHCRDRWPASIRGAR